MKKYYLGWTLLGMSLLLTSLTWKNPNLDKAQEITISNQSDKMITQIYLFDEEGEEITLLTEALPTGQSVKVTVNCGVYTSSIENEDGELCDQYDFEVCKQAEWKISNCENEEE